MKHHTPATIPPATRTRIHQLVWMYFTNGINKKLVHDAIHQEYFEAWYATTPLTLIYIARCIEAEETNQEELADDEYMMERLSVWVQN